MNFLYPQLGAQIMLRILGVAIFGALVGGLYGSLHDQVSYSISTEYFTRMKFQQFAYADFGWPPRLFAAEVGFLASWWVGMIAGWLIGRVGYACLPEEKAATHILRAFAILIGTAILSGAFGILRGYFKTEGDGISEWLDCQNELYLTHTREFAIVAYLHDWSYLGAVLGLVGAVVYLLRRRSKKVRR